MNCFLSPISSDIIMRPDLFYSVLLCNGGGRGVSIVRPHGPSSHYLSKLVLGKTTSLSLSSLLLLNTPIHPILQ